MYQVKATWKGLSPILFSRPKPEDFDPRNPNKRKMSLEEMRAERLGRAYAMNGHYVLPGHMIKATTCEGAKEVGWGKKKSTRPLMKAIFFPTERDFFLAKKLDGLHEDKMIKSDGNMIWAAWPCIKVWKVEFTANVLHDAFPPECVRSAMEIGGLYKGIGSRRPEFGRFEVTDFEVIKEA